MSLSKRGILNFMFGVVFGIVFSPVMWMTLQDHSSLQHYCDSWAMNNGMLRSPIVESGGEAGDPFHGAKEFNLTWEEGVLAPNNPLHRYRTLSYELAPRKTLFIGVVTAKKYLDTRARGIWNTWGQAFGLYDLFYFSSPSDDHDNDLPIITLPGVNDSVYPPQKKVYRMLKYMYDHFLDEYDFFLRADDDMYVKMDRVLELLATINPAQEIYMGAPGFGRPDDRSRIKLTDNEHYCMGGPGVFFSRSALRKLGPLLNTCLEVVVVSYNEDVEVGRCLSKMLNLQCTWAWETKDIFWNDYNKIVGTPALYTNREILRAITIHPIKNPLNMYRVHQYCEEARLRQIMGRAYRAQLSLRNVVKFLPGNLTHFAPRKWLWYDMLTNPSSRNMLSTWQYFNSSHFFFPQEHLPVLPLPQGVEKGIRLALEVLLQVLNEKEKQRGLQNLSIPPYHFFDGFVLMEHSSGVQYNLRLSVHKQARKDPFEYIGNVFLPFNGAGMATYQRSMHLFQKPLHMIINVGETSRLYDFLKMFQDVCIILNNLKVYLHIAMFGTNTNVRNHVADLEAQHPRVSIKLYDVKGPQVLHSAGYEHVIKNLLDDDLLLLMDHSLLFTKEFILHVKANVVQGHQVYLPIFFSFYKPELVSHYLHMTPVGISAQTGFFACFNYQVVGIYKSDYERAMTRTSMSDSVRLIDKLVSSELHVMRALEPHLTRKYVTRKCSPSLSDVQQQACKNSKADAIGSKRMLGSLLASNNLLDT